jgi:hypothetical protein
MMSSSIHDYYIYLTTTTNSIIVTHVEGGVDAGGVARLHLDRRAQVAVPVRPLRLEPAAWIDRHLIGSEFSSIGSSPCAADLILMLTTAAGYLSCGPSVASAPSCPGTQSGAAGPTGCRSPRRRPWASPWSSGSTPGKAAPPPPVVDGGA